MEINEINENVTTSSQMTGSMPNRVAQVKEKSPAVKTQHKYFIDYFVFSNENNCNSNSI